MGLLELVGGGLMYGLVGLLWARSRAVPLQKRLKAAEDYYKRHNPNDGWLHPIVRTDEPWWSCGQRWDDRTAQLYFGLLIHAACWPVLIPCKIMVMIIWTLFDCVHAVLGFAAQPVLAQVNKAKDLREQADALRETLLMGSLGSDEYELIRKAKDELVEQAKALDPL